jgi:rhamnulokinase
VSAQFLAFDLGAESGRAMLGRLRDGLLDVSEIHRFPNEPVRTPGALQWDILRLWREMRRTLEHPPEARLDSLGVDTWGCDYALLDEAGTLLQNPFHYRDARTDGVMEEVFRTVPAERIYAITGIQFLTFNTLYQLYAASRATPRLLEAACAFATIADLLNYWLTGELVAEYTNATTTQFVDARSRAWATGLLADLGLPSRGRRWGGCARSCRRRSPACRWWRRPATTPAPRWPRSASAAAAPSSARARGRCSASRWPRRSSPRAPAS